MISIDKDEAFLHESASVFRKRYTEEWVVESIANTRQRHLGDPFVKSEHSFVFEDGTSGSSLPDSVDQLIQMSFVNQQKSKKAPVPGPSGRQKVDKTTAPEPKRKRSLLQLAGILKKKLSEIAGTPNASEQLESGTPKSVRWSVEAGTAITNQGSVKSHNPLVFDARSRRSFRSSSSSKPLIYDTRIGKQLGARQSRIGEYEIAKTLQTAGIQSLANPKASHTSEGSDVSSLGVIPIYRPAAKTFSSENSSYGASVSLKPIKVFGKSNLNQTQENCKLRSPKLPFQELFSGTNAAETTSVAQVAVVLRPRSSSRRRSKSAGPKFRFELKPSVKQMNLSSIGRMTSESSDSLDSKQEKKSSSKRLPLVVDASRKFNVQAEKTILPFAQKQHDTNQDFEDSRKRSEPFEVASEKLKDDAACSSRCSKPGTFRPVSVDARKESRRKPENPDRLKSFMQMARPSLLVSGNGNLEKKSMIHFQSKLLPARRKVVPVSTFRLTPLERRLRMLYEENELDMFYARKSMDDEGPAAATVDEAADEVQAVDYDPSGTLFKLEVGDELIDVSSSASLLQTKLPLNSPSNGPIIATRLKRSFLSLKRLSMAWL